MQSSYNNLPLIAIAGPTATGKTEVSFHLARRIHAEIVSCDSMQIYKGLDVGTSKPTKEMLSSVPHHLISLMKHDRVFSVAEYIRMAASNIEKIRKEGKNAILAGGTGLYLKCLFEGLFEGPPRDKKIRNKLKVQIDEKGLESLYKDLRKRDPDYANVISSNDERRIMRALEVMEIRGEKFSVLQKNTASLVKEPYRIFCLLLPRKELYRRIDKRVDGMMQCGLVDEARELFEENISPDATLLQAIGYKELFLYFQGEVSLEEAVCLIKRNTRRYAKRQMTWFKKMKNVVWVEAGRDTEKIIKDILKEVKEEDDRDT
ncbi:MAG: tRNA (adenosine(37)-N6)-dimethylallyltransferase MiaA [Candidatus Aureabacteria bacterium]|nr:tRNA (adenosine(37)-N6)-dimethylallyltransferase MiaA [Candidatus Auribacterota bacterium]